MRHGPSTMLTALANHSTRIAMAASPAARKMALIRNSSRTLPLAPTITRAKLAPVRTTSGLAPIVRSSVGAVAIATAPTTTPASTPTRIDWTAARAAASGFFSPMRLDTVAVAPIDSPIATA